METQNIILTGSSGGIGSAIKKMLKDHNLICWKRGDGIDRNYQFDWLVCSHGVIDENDIFGTFRANVISQIELAETLKPKNVVLISSTSGVTGNDKFPIYSASKAALNMYAKLKGYYVVCPGPTDTKMWRKLGLEGKAQDPDEVAKVVERIINGEIKEKLITIKNGEISYEKA